MTQRAKLRAPRKNVLTAAPAQLAYSGFLSRPEGGRDERRVRREDFPGADCRFAWKAAPSSSASHFMYLSAGRLEGRLAIAGKAL
jgi:hypothetical protein